MLLKKNKRTRSGRLPRTPARTRPGTRLTGPGDAPPHTTPNKAETHRHAPTRHILFSKDTPTNDPGERTFQRLIAGREPPPA